MKKDYAKPEMEITSIKTADVITVSIVPTFNAGNAEGISSSEIPF